MTAPRRPPCSPRRSKEGLRNVAAGANPMSLKRGIERATELAVEAIKNQSKEVDDKAQIANVGAISRQTLRSARRSPRPSTRSARTA